MMMINEILHINYVFFFMYKIYIQTFV